MLETLRTLIIAALVFVGFLLWQTWQEQYDVTTTTVTHNTQTDHATQSLPNIPSLPASSPLESTFSAEVVNLENQDHEHWIHVTTDVLTATIDLQGGAIVHYTLKDYAKTPGDAEALTLFNTIPGQLYIAESGLVGDMGPDVPAIAGVRGQKIAKYTSEKTDYSLPVGEECLKVALHWKDVSGLTVEKKYIFHRGKYDITLEQQVYNATQQDWIGSQFLQFKRDEITQSNAGLFAFPSYFGAAISSPEKRYEKIPFDELKQNLGTTTRRTVTDGWLAMVEHYFLGAWIPDAAQAYQYEGGLLQGTTYFVRAVGQPVRLAPGEQAVFNARLYGGPKITDTLKTMAPKLDLTVDYGWLWPISQGLFWVMDEVHTVLNNWGWSIVLVTLLIKLAFYKLSATSYRSMANMRRLQPKFVALKERYGDDRQKMSQELMALYKKEKINPLGGCLPILVQIPVFIALYWVLIESVEFRQAPFMLWVQDLSAKDPYYVLPLLMGLTMFMQQRLSPQPPDPLQAKVMMFMPILFTVIFLNFPSGLVLYWLVNNILSIAQQWYITHKIELNAGKK